MFARALGNLGHTHDGRWAAPNIRSSLGACLKRCARLLQCLPVIEALEDERFGAVGDRYDCRIACLAKHEYLVASNPAGYEHDGPEWLDCYEIE